MIEELRQISLLLKRPHYLTSGCTLRLEQGGRSEKETKTEDVENVVRQLGAKGRRLPKLVPVVGRLCRSQAKLPRESNFELHLER